jgi:hypothetical protein
MRPNTSNSLGLRHPEPAEKQYQFLYAKLIIFFDKI